jgi:predicted RNA-binding protein YlqC (UPF0109 family)
MEELLIALASGLVDQPDEVRVVVDEPNAEGITVYHLRVADDDMGRVIGKQGKIAKAIRTVMRAVANRNRLKISVEIDEEESSAAKDEETVAAKV